MPGPAFVAAIVDVVPAPRRPHAFNLQFWAFNLGTAAAGLIAGGLARLGFLPLFLSDAGTTLVTGLLILLWVPESAPHRVADAMAPPRGGLRTALTDRIFLVFVGLALLQAVLSAQSSTILPLQMRADGLSPSGYGLVMALAGGLIVVGQLFVPRLIAGRRKARVLAVSLVLTGLGYGSVGLAGSLGPYLACATVWTAGAMLAAPPNATIMAELAPPLLRARYQAVFFLTFALAGFLAPALGGLSWQHLGSAYWLVIGAAGLLAAAGHLAAGPARERRVAAEDQAVPEVVGSATP
jgi:predicted MFS family arabinose efflux permease